MFWIHEKVRIFSSFGVSDSKLRFIIILPWTKSFLIKKSLWSIQFFGLSYSYTFLRSKRIWSWREFKIHGYISTSNTLVIVFPICQIQKPRCCPAFENIQRILIFSSMTCWTRILRLCFRQWNDRWYGNKSSMFTHKYIYFYFCMIQMDFFLEHFVMVVLFFF